MGRARASLHPRLTCAYCPADAPPDRWHYTLKLLVEDATAQLDVLLYGPDCDAFFAGQRPCDLRADAAAGAEVLRQLHVLLGQGCQRWVGWAGLGWLGQAYWAALPAPCWCCALRCMCTPRVPLTPLIRPL